MAWKASKTKLVKSKYLISAIIFGAMVPYMTVFGNIFGHIMKSSRNQYTEAGNLLVQCLGVKSTLEMNKIHLLVNVVLSVIFVGSGLFFDIKMLIFVRNRNKIEPIQLVPWKSTNAPEKEKDDITVPLRASFVSTASLVFFAILAPIYVVLVNQMGE
jgi:amino acid transporter